MKSIKIYLRRTHFYNTVVYVLFGKLFIMHICRSWEKQKTSWLIYLVVAKVKLFKQNQVWHDLLFSNIVHSKCD